MRNITKIVLLFGVLALIFSSCRKEEMYDGFFKYEDVEYNLTTGYLEQYQDSSIYYNIVYLFSPGFNFVISDSIVEEISGSGNILVFYFYDTESHGLFPKRYTLRDPQTSLIGASGYLLLGYDANTGSLSTGYSVFQGTITIATSGSKFNISFEGVTNENQSLSGSFQGYMEYKSTNKIIWPLYQSFF